MPWEVRLRAVDVIRAVRDGQSLAPNDIQNFISGIASGAIPDYQASAYLMAVYHRGLEDSATVATTLAMRDSGDVVDLSTIDLPKVDKHSTGGVGDKISLPLAPLVAACGVLVPMISGRGLGHTGGTLDKLESIPGFNVGISEEQFIQQLKKVGIALVGATSRIAPADRKLYALRDVTATIESIPLITASILSKKLAAGNEGLVLDVKVGRGAFMKNLKDARKLAESLVRVGAGAGLDITAYLTDMDQPLGTTIGNALEIKESVQILKGEGPPDTTELTLKLGAEMLVLARVAATLEEGESKLSEVLRTGAGLNKFIQVVEAQGGDARVVENPDLLPTAGEIIEINALEDGWVQDVDPLGMGLLAMVMGAGRSRVEDQIDPAVGLELLVRKGDEVKRNQPLGRMHLRRRDRLLEERFYDHIEIGPSLPNKANPLIYQRITP